MSGGDSILSLLLCCSSSVSHQLKLQSVSSTHSGENTTTIHMNLAGKKPSPAWGR